MATFTAEEFEILYGGRETDFYRLYLLLNMLFFVLHTMDERNNDLKFDFDRREIESLADDVLRESKAYRTITSSISTMLEAVDFLIDGKSIIDGISSKDKEAVLRVGYCCSQMGHLFQLLHTLEPLQDLMIIRNMEALGRSVLGAAHEIIGYWEKNMKLKRSAHIGGKAKKEAMEKRVEAVLRMVTERGKQEKEGSLEIDREEWEKIFMKVFDMSINISPPTKKSYQRRIEQILSSKKRRDIKIVIKK